jgi:hypothetical protein
MQLKLILFIAFILIILSFYSGYNFKKDNLIIENKIDTIFELKTDTLFIEKKAKIIYKKDTIILTKPFDAEIDTTIKNNLVKINYSFPENIIKFNLIRQDSLITLHKIKVIKQNQKECFLYGYLTGIATSGLLIYLIK